MKRAPKDMVSNPAGPDDGLQRGGRELRIMVAGAGTGGHLFPGIAVVERLTTFEKNVRPCFVTTGRPIEKTVLAGRNYETRPISAAGMKGTSIWGKTRSMGLLARGLLEARAMLKNFRPHLVLGMGGYSSAPVIIAAWMMGIPRVIHEQNRIPGITNRLLGRFSDRVHVSFPDTKIPGAGNKIRYSGYPVRPEIGKADKTERSPEAPLTIIVLGGSQGARSINRTVAAALDFLDNIGHFAFIHQAGAGDEAFVRAAYEKKQAEARVSAFFEDMAAVYRQADMAISRAGAGTLAELAAARVPAILVPYPHAADNHQAANAEGMAEAGGARILMEKELTPEALAALMNHYRLDPEALGRMRANIEKQFADRDAAGEIAEDILELTGFVREKNGF